MLQNCDILYGQTDLNRCLLCTDTRHGLSQDGDQVSIRCLYTVYRTKVSLGLCISEGQQLSVLS